MEPPTVVIDNGTGYTKMGYSGNMDPSYIIPSTIATSLNKVSLVLLTILIFRKIPNLKAMRWTIILETKQWHTKNPTKSATSSKAAKLKIGRVLRSFGISLYTLI
jgi:actin-related protein